MIYLDNAATTKVSGAVISEMERLQSVEFGNPGSLYSLGRAAEETVTRSRKIIAAGIGAKPDDLIFTSGGSESNSTVFRGISEYLKQNGKTQIIISSIEHPSVLNAAASLQGFEIIKVDPNKNGVVRLESIAERITEKTGLVSVMAVNNETGAVQPIKEIGEICASAGVFFHSDCVQALGTVPISVDEFGLDFASFSAHKIHGPKGVGALYCRKKEFLNPIIFGGEQEFSLRAGTENVPGIAGFAKAVDHMGNSQTACALSTMFYNEIIKDPVTADCILHGDPEKIEKILNIYVPGVINENLILMLDTMGMCISGGSACTSHSGKPSHVLSAMGISDEEASQSVRISFSKNELKPTSFDRLERTLNHQVFPIIGHIQLAALTADDVQNLVNTLRDDGKSYSVIKKAYDSINDCFRTGVIKKTATINPALGVSLPKQVDMASGEVRCYSVEDMEKICKAAIQTCNNGVRKFRLGDIVQVAVNTGMRASELSALRWENVDFENRVIHVNSSIVYVKDRKNGGRKHILQNSTKSLAGARKIYINDDTFGALQHLKEISNGSDYVFATKNGTPITPVNMDGLLYRIMTAAGIPNEKQYGIHSLRHTFASMLFANREDVKTVSTLLGHSSTTITYNIYIHLISEQDKNAVRKIPKLIEIGNK